MRVKEKILDLLSMHYMEIVIGDMSFTPNGLYEIVAEELYKLACKDVPIEIYNGNSRLTISKDGEEVVLNYQIYNPLKYNDWGGGYVIREKVSE